MNPIAMGRPVLPIVWLAITTGGIGAQTPLAEVPFTLHRAGVIVEAVVNSRDTVRLLVDTGWGPLALLTNSARRIGLESTGGGAYPIAPAASLSIGGAVKREVRFELFAPETLQPLIGPYDGVLSTAFFRDLVLQIDYPGKLLRLFAAAPPAGTTAHRIPMAFAASAGWLPFSDSVTYDGRQVRALFDTGGAGAFLGMPRIVDRLRLALLPDTGQRIGIGMFEGGQARQANLRFAQGGRVTIGSLVREAARLPIAPAQLEGGSWGHDLIIGFGFFKDYVVTFDYPGRTIGFEVSGSPAR